MLSRSPQVTPDNPTQVGWSASKIRQYQWKPLDILFDFIELVDRASVDSANEIFTDISELNERIVHMETTSFATKLKSGDSDAFRNEKNQEPGDFYIIEGIYEEASSGEDVTQTPSEASRQVSRMIMKSPSPVAVSVESAPSEPAVSADDGGLTIGNVSDSADGGGYVTISDSGLYAYPMGITDEIAESNAALIKGRKASTRPKTSSSAQLAIPSSAESSATLSLEAGNDTEAHEESTSAPALVIRSTADKSALSLDGSSEEADKGSMLSLGGSSGTDGLSLL